MIILINFIIMVIEFSCKTNQHVVQNFDIVIYI